MGPDFTTLTGGIDVSTVIAAVMAVAGIGVTIVLASGGANKVLGFLSGVFKR